MHEPIKKTTEGKVNCGTIGTDQGFESSTDAQNCVLGRSGRTYIKYGCMGVYGKSPDQLLWLCSLDVKGLVQEDIPIGG